MLQLKKHVLGYNNIYQKNSTGGTKLQLNQLRKKTNNATILISRNDYY